MFSCAMICVLATTPAGCCEDGAALLSRTMPSSSSPTPPPLTPASVSSVRRSHANSSLSSLSSRSLFVSAGRPASLRLLTSSRSFSIFRSSLAIDALIVLGNIGPLSASSSISSSSSSNVTSLASTAMIDSESKRLASRTCLGKIFARQYSLASASDKRTSASNCLTVIL